MFEELIQRLKAAPRQTIVFTEGNDLRILEATAQLNARGFLNVVLVGNEAEVKGIADQHNLRLDGVRIVDPETYPNMDAMVEKMYELRKGKMEKEQCASLLKHGNYFGTMLVVMGEANCLLGGATYTTADTVRPALQLIKTRPGAKMVSSAFVLNRPAAFGQSETILMGDCAINIKPSEDELAVIAIQVANAASVFGLDPRIAFLSYSTKGSGAGEDVDKVRNACQKAQKIRPDLKMDGEFQFDAAVSPVVAKTKHIDGPVGGHANTFIFPDINAGNIGYKIAQRLGGFEAVGPILLGLNAPINDLSRGCNAQEVYSMAIITAALA
jgi:phosphate acetyltransferase